MGSYASLERYKDNLATGSDKNDFQTVSTRFFLKGEEIAGTDWESFLDVRDKHDFFDKLNRERLTLEARNEFQLRQVSLRNSDPKKFWGGQIGRFPVYQAGAGYVDGALVENHFTPNLFLSYFGGLNPKKRERSYLEFDSKSNVYGAALSYLQPKVNSTDFYVNHAIVVETYSGHTDRNFLYQNGSYQWAPHSRFISLLYYDLVPEKKLQNGNLVWQQGWTSQLTTDLTGLTMDVIEYTRRKEILERLPSSPYSEASLRLTYRFGDMQDRLYFLGSSGRRGVDGFTRTIFEIGYAKSRFWGPHWDGYFVLGSRKNFVSNDLLTRFGFGRFGKKWELNLDFEYQKQQNGDGTVTHPQLAEVSCSYFVSRQTYLSFAGQTASDEKVQIYSGFIKLGYRFGSRNLSPLRDGAPPRGPL